MELSEAETTSTIHRSFLEYAGRNTDCRSRASFAALWRDNPLPEMSPHPWPLFTEMAAADELAPIALGLDRLVKSVPERFFGNDPARLASFYGAARELAELVISEPNGVAGAISRGDFLEGPEGLQCLEMNAGSFVGGWQLQALEEHYLGCPMIARFLQEQGLRAGHRNTIRLMFRHIIRDALGSGLGIGQTLNLAMIIHPHKPLQVAVHSSALYNREYSAALAAERPGLAGQVFLCGYRDLADERDGLYFQGERAHAVVEQHNGEPDHRGFRHFKRGTISFYSGPVTQLLSDKRNLALLSERAASQDLTAEERGLLERHLPWTRLVRDTTTAWRGRQVRLPALLAEDRRRFVLKKATSLGGKDVHLGKSLSAAEWEGVLREALSDPGWIAQELIEPRPALFLDAGDRVVPHDVVWGLFAFGDTFGGVFLRLLPSDRGGIVNTNNGAEVGVLLEIEPSARPAV